MRSLIGQIPSLRAAQKKEWADHILQLADRKKNKTPLRTGIRYAEYITVRVAKGSCSPAAVKPGKLDS